MLPYSLESLDEEKLEALFEAGAFEEQRNLEFKQQMPGKKNSDVLPFIEEIVAFANTHGGDLLVGVVDNKHRKGPKVFQALTCVEGGQSDQIRQRLDSLLNTKIEPRVYYEIKVIPLQSHSETRDSDIYIIRVPRSWRGPHATNNNGYPKFSGRTSSGKYTMDYDQVRMAFLSAQSLPEKAEVFRKERVLKIHEPNHTREMQTPVSLTLGAKIILHILPLQAFSGYPINLEISQLVKNILVTPRPLGPEAGTYRTNLLGLVRHDAQRSAGNHYGQLYRDGCFETLAIMKKDDAQSRLLVRIHAIEEQIKKVCCSYRSFARQYNLELPFAVMLSLSGFKNSVPEVSMSEFLQNPEPLKDDPAFFPNLTIEQWDKPLEESLAPLFDTLWQAYGMLRPSR